VTIKTDTIILAIESSCDDTAASVIKNGKICSNIVATQDVHAQYGGVVPELASRAHQQNIVPTIEVALKEAQCAKSELSAVAYTQGPGLLGSLLVGSGFAKSLSLTLNIPLIGVDHLEAHILAHFIDDPKPQFPFLCLLVSGGHTQIIRVDAPDNMVILGSTRDDAAGEAFDKSAKLLGLPYPGGPEIDRLAKQGNPHAFDLPEANIPGYDYSFSGLKTAIRNLIHNHAQKDPDFIREHVSDFAATIQRRIVSTLLNKLEQAIEQTGINNIALAGGVSANSELRSSFNQLADKHGLEAFVPAFEYCTDNAAMIAMAAHFKYLGNDFATLEEAPYARRKNGNDE
jgi:N6-L-threonylcarbamoyladenine synthase